MQKNTNSMGSNTVFWYGTSLLCIVLVFWTDFLTPLGFAHGWLYLVALILSAFSRREAFILAIAALSAVLTILGYFISPPGFELVYVIGNRSLSVVGIVLLGGFFTFLNRQLAVMERKNLELESTQKVINTQKELLDIAAEAVHLGGWRMSLPDFTITWSDNVRSIHHIDSSYEPHLDDAILFYVPEYRERIRQVVDACMREGIPFDEEAELITGDDKRIWVRAIGRAEYDEVGNIIGLQGAFLDISADKALEQRYRKQHESLINTLESITDAFFTLDTQWRFTYVNKAAEEVLHRERKELLDNVVWDLFENADAFRAHYERAVSEQVTVEFLEYYEPLQKWMEVRAFPSEEGLAVYFRDVTARHEYAEEMRLARERFENVARATTDAIWDWDLLSDRVWWNEKMESLFGYRPEDLEEDARSWTAHIHPDDREEVLRTIHQAIEGDRQEWSQEYRFQRRDGTYAHVVDNGFILRDGEGRALRMVGGMEDVTEKRLLEDRLGQSQRLEAIGQLTGGVAHDFNNLLTVIQGNGELLAESLEDNESLYPLVKMTNDAAERASQLTRHLLAFARRQALEPAAVNVRKLLGGMESLLRRTLMANINIELVHGGGLWPAMVDAPQLENAILNLCLNARDAMPEGGRLTIETSNAFLDQGYADRHPDVISGQYVLIAISDTGSGIPDSQLNSVFDPFYTTKEADKGTGLGLSMVYGFIKQSRGHIKIYSELDQGTTVRLYLPKAAEEAVSIQKSAQQVSGGDEKILLVEDDEMVRMYAEHLLADLGYGVISAASGHEGLQQLRDNPDIVLLFTDIIMPGGMNGRQLADQAVLLQPELKVLFTSGYTENAIVHHGRLDPGVHLISKPYLRKDLASKIRQVLGGSGDGAD